MHTAAAAAARPAYLCKLPIVARGTEEKIKGEGGKTASGVNFQACKEVKQGRGMDDGGTA